MSDMEAVEANFSFNEINTEDFKLLPEFYDDENGPIFEDTKEANWTPIPSAILISPIGRPERSELHGPYEFNLEIDGSHTHKKKYLYSHTLNRIYVDMDTNFPVKFNWCAPQHTGELYVRATVAFADDDQAEKRVVRCIQHSHESSDAENTPLEEKMNVLRSARVSGDSSDVYYCGRHDEANSWYSVVVKLSAPASHAYKFVCKNSCTSGINRRATCIIFTLEDMHGTVLGRTTVGVRVCSCPRRDMETDQNRERNKRPAPTATPSEMRRPSTKKLRVDANTSDNDVVQLPSLKIVGLKTAVTGLNVMLAMMQQTRAHRLACQQPVEELNLSITTIKSLIENLEKS